VLGGKPDLKATATLAARLPEVEAKVALEQIQAANPTVDFSPNAMKARAKYMERLPAKVHFHQKAIAKSEEALAEAQEKGETYANIAIFDDKVKTLRRCLRKAREDQSAAPVTKKRRVGGGRSTTPPSKRQKRAAAPIALYDDVSDVSESDSDGGETEQLLHALPSVPTRDLTARLEKL
jgi:transposase-like protein